MFGKATAVAAIVAATFTVAASSAPARGYTCSYTNNGITVTLDGYANSSYYCRVMQSTLNGRRVSRPYGRPACAWRMRAMDVTATVYIRPSYLRSYGCRMIGSGLNRYWIRLY